ncbi:hypothetical protein SAMN05421675_0231 [Pasteurella multocida]|uniref:hypothetical protein n=1 Tax=Pasteurella multocida TaxID=747 RepID=UPI0008EA436D|nr:hypothetical protein [Pasteurella multocida]MBM2609389.1 hypothetical protein [Pasteurella multocida]NNI30469.1 hypothetical protein [Pasteurella multocida]NNI60809.1 hypothetical protein [Pasteurella multocida]NNI75824.1 hypothetical protein [Pasteurella multocida]OWZ82237.1 hypothetical protein CDE51_03165 [Pasteurella multocida]
MDYVNKAEIVAFRDQIQRAMDFLDIAMNETGRVTEKTGRELSKYEILDLTFDELFHLHNKLNSILKS